MQKSLLELGVELYTGHTVTTVNGHSVTLSCCFTNRTKEVNATCIVPVTERIPNDELYRNLESRGVSAELIGDALAPGLIADAVFTGHMAARNFQADALEVSGAYFRRELPALS